MKISKRTPVIGLVALVLAAGVGIAIVALAIGAAWTEAGGGNGQLSTESSTLLSTALGAAIGAIATFLGGRLLEDEDVNEFEIGNSPPPDEAPTAEYPVLPPR